MKKRKHKKFTHFRHKIWLKLGQFFCYPYFFFKFHFVYKKIKRDKRAYLILCNHQTNQDQSFISYYLGTGVYYVASDDLASIPVISRFLDHAIAPIPYKKASKDLQIFKLCRKVIEEGKSVLMFPEGNRTFSGKTEYINPTLSKMALFLKTPIMILNIQGGFGILPRFADKNRRGKFKIVLKEIIEYEDYKDLPQEEIFKRIYDGLYVDESNDGMIYKSKHNAEYLERVIYRCPNCGLTHFKSKGNTLKCLTCDLNVTYNNDKKFSSNSPFKTVNEWYEYQKNELMNSNITDNEPNFVFFEDKSNVFEVIPRKTKHKLYKNINLQLTPEKLILKSDKETREILLSEINSTGVFGKNKFNIYLNDQTLQFKSDKSFNALKYVQFIYKYKIEKEGASNDFLGL